MGDGLYSMTVESAFQPRDERTSEARPKPESSRDRALPMLKVSYDQESQCRQLLTPDLLFKREKQTKPNPVISSFIEKMLGAFTFNYLRENVTKNQSSGFRRG